MTQKAAWILGDQLTLSNSALLAIDPKRDLVFMIESLEHARELNHHKSKLALCFSAMRHFKVELESKGYTVAYNTLSEETSFLSALQSLIKQHHVKELLVMEPHEMATMRVAENLSDQIDIAVSITKNTMFLTDREEFIKKNSGKKHLIMESFYRDMRKKLKVLMEKDGKPVGGEWNLDKENRQTASLESHT
jgi:deoxyribodipyrimidine photolyase-related protein